MESSPNKATPKTTKITPYIPENRPRIKPVILARTYNHQRKKGLTIFCSVRLKDPRFTRLAMNVPKDNKRGYFREKVSTLQKIMRFISKNERNLGSLQKFSLDLVTIRQEFDPADLFSLSQTLQQRPLLQSLKLGHLGCPAEITNGDLDSVGKVLKKRMPFLKEFYFSAGYNRNIIYEGLICLSEGLKRLTSLESLILDLQWCQGFTEFGVSSLSASLKNMVLLQNLTICFSVAGKFTENGALDFCDCLARLISLKNLSLKLPGMADAGLKRFGEALKKLVSLQSFTISLANLGTDVAFSEFFKGVQELANLQYMKIEDLSFAVIDNNGLLHLSKALGRLVRLKNLEVRLASPYNNFDNLTFSCLRKGLKRLKLLENLTLNFGLSHRISDIGLHELGKGLKRLTLLQEISVKFTNSEKITNEGVQIFCENFAKFTHLRRFSFLTEDCRNFNDNGCYMICQVLKDVPSLEVLSLQGRDLAGKERILAALKHPRMYFPTYKENLELPNVKKSSSSLDQGKKTWLNRLFTLWSECVIFIEMLVSWLGGMNTILKV